MTCMNPAGDWTQLHIGGLASMILEQFSKCPWLREVWVHHMSGDISKKHMLTFLDRKAREKKNHQNLVLLDHFIHCYSNVYIGKWIWFFIDVTSHHGNRTSRKTGKLSLMFLLTLNHFLSATILCLKFFSFYVFFWILSSLRSPLKKKINKTS